MSVIGITARVGADAFVAPRPRVQREEACHGRGILLCFPLPSLRASRATPDEGVGGYMMIPETRCCCSRTIRA